MSLRRFAHRPRFRIYFAPTVLAVACLVGLIAGLLGDGAADVVAAIGLGLPLPVLGWVLIRRRR